MSRIRDGIEVTAKAYRKVAPRPARPRRELVFPSVLRGMLAPNRGQGIRLVVSVDAHGEPTVVSIAAPFPLTGFARERLRQAVLQADWEPATDEYGEVVPGERAVLFEVR